MGAKMTDQDLTRTLDQMKFGAAAVGLCIARVLTKSDSTMGQRIAEEAEKMEYRLAQDNNTAAVQIVSNFRRALTNPEKMPLLTPRD